LQTAAIEPDAWIESMRVPARTRIDQRVGVSISIAGRRGLEAALRLDVNGTLLATRALTLAADHVQTVEFTLEPEQVGALLVTAAVTSGAPSQVHEVTKVVNVEGPAPVLYVSRRADADHWAERLRGLGWPAAAASPERFAQWLEQRQPPLATIVLDDISIADLPASSWPRLTHAVRARGAGLIVLGGPHSFGAGGYRRSELESLLPVTAEAREPQPKIAVLFMVDASGSMDQGGVSASRLAMAREAVLETARTLSPGDVAGLLAFDADPHWRLPLAEHADPVEALARGWQAQARGGTRLNPALREAVQRLAETATEKKYLILVTDGFVADQPPQDLEREIARAGIDVIGIGVGDGADEAILTRLARINAGRALHIGEVTTLPVLMRAEIERRRLAIENGPLATESVNALPFDFDAGDGWPDAGPYLLSKARSPDLVYLQSQAGDPLLAAHTAGAGRVLALPGGLGAWAGWPALGRFLGGLLAWADPQQETPGLQLEVTQQAGAVQFDVDSALNEGAWTDASIESTVLLEDPLGRTQAASLDPVAPGRLHASVPVTTPGRYRATLHAGNRSVRHDFFYNAEREQRPALSLFPDLLQQGLVRPWPAQGLRNAGAVASTSARLRGALLAITLALYVLLLGAERRPDLLRTAKQALPSGTSGRSPRLRVSSPPPASAERAG
jgi:Mg-chelatase subunit ChlD